MSSAWAPLLGIPESVQAGLDAVLDAAMVGPAALDRELDAIDREGLRVRLRAAALHLTHATTPRRGARAALEDFDRAEERTDRALVRRGGNR